MPTEYEYDESLLDHDEPKAKSRAIHPVVVLIIIIAIIFIAGIFFR